MPRTELPPHWTDVDRERYEERAAILEFDALMPRERAERRAREMCEPRPTLFGDVA